MAYFANYLERRRHIPLPPLRKFENNIEEQIPKQKLIVL